MPPPNAPDPIDILFRDVEDFFQGRYYYTIYCPPTRARHFLFKASTWKNYFYLILLLNAFFELAIFANESSELKFNNPGATSSNSNHLVRNPSMSSINVFFQRKDSNEKYSKGGSLVSEQMESANSKSKESPEQKIVQEKGQPTSYPTKQVTKTRIISFTWRLWAFVVRCIAILLFFVGIEFAVSALTLLFEVTERHLIAATRQELIGGLFRLKRVTQHNSRDSTRSEGL